MAKEEEISEDIFQERNKTTLRCENCGGSFYETGEHRENHSEEEVQCCGCGRKVWVCGYTLSGMTI